jgi:heme-degrading monooxygenase HmoA
MTELITTGTWIVEDSKQAAFVDAWTEFASWASAMDGAKTLRLGRDARDRSRFVSFGPWDAASDVQAWKASPEFQERIARVLQHVSEFQPSELDVVASAVRGGAAVSVANTPH